MQSFIHIFMFNYFLIYNIHYIIPNNFFVKFKVLVRIIVIVLNLKNMFLCLSPLNSSVIIKTL